MDYFCQCGEWLGSMPTSSGLCSDCEDEFMMFDPWESWEEPDDEPWNEA